ncbi:MAG: DNA-directed RNA polymerase subunit alpha [Bacilli bacterium]
MMQIEKPRITHEENEDGSFTRIIVEPLEGGFGTTLGNSMRRVLLASLPGIAPVAVRIAGVAHEFSCIKGVREDVTEIVLNLKCLALATYSSDPELKVTMRLKAKGSKTLYARDIETSSEIEVRNPDLYLCTLDEDGEMDMEITVMRGRGYVQAEQNKDEIESIGYIAIDSIFTPIKSVNFYTEGARVGNNMGYDKLVLEVTTNRTKRAIECCSLAGKILQDHMQLFVDLVEDMKDMEILVSPEEDKNVKILSMSIDDLELSVRSHNCLKRANINTVEELVKKTKEEMLKVKNLGAKSLEEVIEKIENLGLKLRNDEE